MINIVLCAGSQSRFESTTPKQLMPFNDIPLLQRTMSQIKSGYVVTHNSDIIDFCHKKHYNLFYPSRYSKCVLTLLSTQNLWKNRTNVFLGDVYYNEKCLELTFNCQQNLCVIGTQVEIFSISFVPSKRILKALKASSEHSQGKLWHFYRAYSGIPLDQHKRDSEGIFKIPSDGTTDIDTTKEYYKLKYKIIRTSTPFRLSY